MAMAGALSLSSKPSLNPLKCGGTPLPPNVLLMTKLIALCLLLTGGIWRELPGPFLPFVPILDHIGPAAVYHRVLQVALLVAAISLLLNRHVRTSCLVLGSVILFAILCSKPFYQSNRLFSACLLLMAGLEQPSQEPWLIRWQVAILYFGAGLNKLLDVDWCSGQFFENWVVRLHHQALYMRVSGWLPNMLLSRIMGWTTILTELSLSIGFLVPRFYGLALWGNVIFQTALMFSAKRTFGMFYYAMLASCLAFVKWPQPGLTVLYDGGCSFCIGIKNLFRKIDFEEWFHWMPFEMAATHHGISVEASRGRLHLVGQGRVHSGFEAIRRLLLYNPPTYFLIAVLLAAPSSSFAYRRWIAVILLGLFSPLFAPAGEALCDLAAGNRHWMGRKQNYPAVAGRL
jgi:predicted DCC family thiol-disulfide oxidoreductase YuxK